MAFLLFDSDGITFHLLGVPVRYYGLAIIATLWSGFYVWLRQARRIGIDANVALRWLYWGAFGVLVGSRLGHCLFYEPMRYLQNPVEILQLWKGGASSHGAAIGIVLSSALYARRYRLSTAEVLDQLALVMPAASFMRLGNFMNSEIVGHVTNVPWAVRFARYDGGQLPRHPVQLYEFLIGALVFLAVFVLEKRCRSLRPRPRGQLMGGFLVLYFVCRVVVESVKVDDYALNGQVLTSGQVLSIPPILIGVAVLLVARRGGFGFYRGTQ